MIRAVVFGIGECLIDQTREFGGWADWLGVPRHTFAAQFGAIVAQGRDHHETFEVFRPGFDIEQERIKREACGEAEWYGENDLYPDVRLAFKELRQAGLFLGVAGNHTARMGRVLRTMFSSHVHLTATSGEWGVAKPDPRFFQQLTARVAERFDAISPEEILYVGDRIDHDVRPASAVGLTTALVVRGPWGVIHQHHPDAALLPTMRLTSLRQLIGNIQDLNSSEF
ncbi:HAD family hydrolase [Streptomyces sp. 4N509B]|uniref:HAD family hydrolase n=1 Tax=Streptomyces sp. 4N509B TaxID=3457413 RepID=UPI003FD2F95A